MPPMFINVGAYVGEGTLVDSHALIGSCAQVGRNCHISAGVQIGGVLEPIGALPVIVEDDVSEQKSGVYEGTVIKRRAVIGTGTVPNRSTPVYDLVRSEVHISGTAEEPLVIPENAVVVPGGRAITKGKGAELGHLPLHSGDRQVSRRGSRRQDSAGGLA